MEYESRTLEVLSVLRELSETDRWGVGGIESTHIYPDLSWQFKNWSALMCDYDRFNYANPLGSAFMNLFRSRILKNPGYSTAATCLAALTRTVHQSLSVGPRYSELLPDGILWKWYDTWSTYHGLFRECSSKGSDQPTPGILTDAQMHVLDNVIPRFEYIKELFVPNHTEVNDAMVVYARNLAAKRLAENERRLIDQDILAEGLIASHDLLDLSFLMEEDTNEDTQESHYDTLQMVLGSIGWIAMKDLSIVPDLKERTKILLREHIQQKRVSVLVRMARLTVRQNDLLDDFTDSMRADFFHAYYEQHRYDWVDELKVEGGLTDNVQDLVEQIEKDLRLRIGGDLGTLIDETEELLASPEIDRVEKSATVLAWRNIAMKDRVDAPVWKEAFPDFEAQLLAHKEEIQRCHLEMKVLIDAEAELLRKK